MKKSDKKLEKSIVSALTDACENALEAYEGFQWLTHLVNYDSFPDTLRIICVFDTQESLMKVSQTDLVNRFKLDIEARLISEGIKAKGITKRISFDSEEACEKEHNGHWGKRLEGV